MASRLENAARKALGGDSIMDGRESIKTRDIIAKYPDGICINGLAFVSNNGNKYPVFTFLEEPSKFFSGGTALTRLAEGTLEEYDGNLTELNNDLRKYPLKIKLLKTRTKRGYDFTKVIVIGVLNVDGEDEIVDLETGEVLFS